jgi:hypothetical protein
MPEDQTIPPTPKPAPGLTPRKRWPLVAFSTIGALVAGFFFGVLFDAHFRPNYITFDLDSEANQVNLMPRKHDVIKWVVRPTDTIKSQGVNAGFLTDPPCTQGQDKSICTIAVATGRYTYGCPTLSDGTKVYCEPGIDPQPNDSPTIMRPLFGSFKVALGEDPGADFINTSKDIPVSGTAGGGAGSVRQAHAEPGGIKCDETSHSPVVTSLTDPNNPTADITVAVDRKVQWTSGQKTFTVGNFLVNGTKTKICAQQADENSVMDNNHSVCKVLASAIPAIPPGQTSYRVAYTVTTSGSDACPTPTSLPGTIYLTVNSK